MEESKIEKTDEDISREFLDEYRKLCIKYKRDWFIEPVIPKIAKVDFKEQPK